MAGWCGGAKDLFGWLGMGLFWVLLLGLIVWLIVRLLPGSTDGPTHESGESALEILDRRLSSGELDLQEWQAQRTALLAALREVR